MFTAQSTTVPLARAAGKSWRVTFTMGTPAATGLLLLLVSTADGDADAARPARRNFVRTSAYNANGLGGPRARGEPSGRQAPAAQAPTAPTDVRATALSAARVGVSWRATANDGGAAVARYMYAVQVDTGEEIGVNGVRALPVTGGLLDSGGALT